MEKIKQPDPRLAKIGAKFKKLRLEKGYTSYENFAFDNDISRIQYWRIESGKANFTMTTLLRLLDAHNITLSEFFNDL